MDFSSQSLKEDSMKREIEGKSKETLEREFKDLGLPKFRAGQVYRQVHVNRATSFYQMTDLSKDLREELDGVYKFADIKVLQEFDSKVDDTKKYLFELADKNIIEAVYMNYGDRKTVCISSQVGCRMGCLFCASTKNGLERNLTASELLGEVYALERENSPINNIVIMGIGEPLDNFENITSFIERITDPQGRDLSHRSITLSTSGLVPKIYDLADSGLGVNLALSLHYADDEKRKSYMPIAKRYSIEEIVKACDYYLEKTGRRVSYEYVVIDGVNNLDEDVKNLEALFSGKNVHINLIPLNPISEFSGKRPDERVLEAFKAKLAKRGLNATIRSSRGSDIDASCGQLRNNYARKV